MPEFVPGNKKRYNFSACQKENLNMRTNPEVGETWHKS